MFWYEIKAPDGILDDIDCLKLRENYGVQKEHYGYWMIEDIEGLKLKKKHGV